MRQTTKDRKEQIIAAALSLIRESGLKNLTIKHLSQQVGISEQAIYRHYDNKASILTALILHFNQTLSTSIKQLVHKNNNVLITISKIIMAHLIYFTERPEMAALVYPEEVFRAEPLIRPQIEATIEKRIQTITDMVEKAQQNNSIKSDLNPENVALIVFGAIRILITNWRFSGFSYDLLEKGKSLIDDLCLMLKP